MPDGRSYLSTEMPAGSKISNLAQWTCSRANSGFWHLTGRDTAKASGLQLVVAGYATVTPLAGIVAAPLKGAAESVENALGDALPTPPR